MAHNIIVLLVVGVPRVLTKARSRWNQNNAADGDDEGENVHSSE